MRTRTILVSLLAVYAVVSTAYFIFHTGTNRGGLWRQVSNTTGPATAADSSLPIAPPFVEPKASTLSGKDLSARVQLENELRYTDLQSFVCSETMERFKGHLVGEDSHRIDTVAAHVSFENGVENYSSIEQNKHQRMSFANLSGAWSEGEFGTLLRQSRTLLATQPVSLETGPDVNGQAVFIYRTEVPGQDSPWELIVEGKKYRVPFKTEISVSKANGAILQIKRTSTAMPPDFGISEIAWSVNLKPIQMDGKEWLLPDTGQYSVEYQKTDRREWNLITFSDYHRYTASSMMHF